MPEKIATWIGEVSGFQVQTVGKDKTKRWAPNLSFSWQIDHVLSDRLERVSISHSLMRTEFRPLTALRTPSCPFVRV